MARGRKGGADRWSREGPSEADLHGAGVVLPAEPIVATIAVAAHGLHDVDVADDAGASRYGVDAGPLHAIGALDARGAGVLRGEGRELEAGHTFDDVVVAGGLGEPVALEQVPVWETSDGGAVVGGGPRLLEEGIYFGSEDLCGGAAAGGEGDGEHDAKEAEQVADAAHGLPFVARVTKLVRVPDLESRRVLPPQSINFQRALHFDTKRQNCQYSNVTLEKSALGRIFDNASGLGGVVEGG